MGSRRKARELALQMLFQHDLSGNDPAMILTTFEDLRKVRPPIRDFAARLFEGTVAETQKLDDIIQAQSENWRMSRMAVVDRNIIRMSVWEFLHQDDTPKLVIIDEAIEIAKRFGTQKSSQFVNGVLDGILRSPSFGEK
jgi:transcription antitermination protein NusB